MLPLLALLGTLVTASPNASASPAVAKNVFVLNSYRPGAEWTDGELEGIHKQFGEAPFEIQTWVDYLDSQRNSNAADLFRLRYREQHAKRKYDLVIATDDDALSLLVNDAALFAGTPVVFGGVSDPGSLTGLPRDRITGVREVFAELAMVDAALRIHPNTRRLFLIGDGSPNSRYFVESLRRRAATAAWSLEILDGQNLTFDEVLEALRRRSPGDLVFLASLLHDKTGAYLSPARANARMSAAAPVPIYGLASLVGNGLLCGSANTGINHGRRIAAKALEVLGGARPADLPISDDIENAFEFDAREMARFGIPYSKLPPNAQLLFQQDSVLERYQGWILLAAAFTALQMVIIGGLAFSILQRRKVELALERSNARLEEQNQELAAAAETKKRFVANMSHELRTPMNAIIGMSDLLLDTPLETRQREFAETVRNSARSLLGILNDVLELSRMESGHLRIELAPFSPRMLTDELVRSLHSVTAEGVTLSADLHPDLPPFLTSDPNRVRQVLLNFLFNAIKFTRQGSILLRAAPGGEGRFRFSVSDTGIGIGPNQLGRVFERFYQVDDSTSRQFGGSGLGLAISREIVRALNGEIGVTSEPGCGSTFWFEIPAASGHQAPPAEQAVPPPPPGLRVLVVEDNAVNLRLARLLLEKLGCSVTTAGGGAEALQTLQDSTFDVIFMDVQMPDMDGLEATRQIRCLEGALRHTPIIALTAGVSAQDRSQCFEAGMDAHLAKPVSRNDLAEVLARYSAPIVH
jgi:signal transduction histidine kinase/CheY-like chemotaxis protein